MLKATVGSAVQTRLPCVPRDRGQGTRQGLVREKRAVRREGVVRFEGAALDGRGRPSGGGSAYGREVTAREEKEGVGEEGEERRGEV